MITKIIPIPSNDSKIYRQILGVLNFITRLTNQEIDVLSEIVRLNHEYEALPELKRAKFILSTEMRKEIRELLNIEEKQFNSLIGRLKTKQFLDKFILDENGILHNELFIKPDSDGFKIEIILKKSDISISKKIEPKEEIENNTIIEEDIKYELINPNNESSR